MSKAEQECFEIFLKSAEKIQSKTKTAKFHEKMMEFVECDEFGMQINKNVKWSSDQLEQAVEIISRPWELETSKLREYAIGVGMFKNMEKFEKFANEIVRNVSKAFRHRLQAIQRKHTFETCMAVRFFGELYNAKVIDDTIFSKIVKELGFFTKGNLKLFYRLILLRILAETVDQKSKIAEILHGEIDSSKIPEFAMPILTKLIEILTDVEPRQIITESTPENYKKLKFWHREPKIKKKHHFLEPQPIPGTMMGAAMIEKISKEREIVQEIGKRKRLVEIEVKELNALKAVYEKKRRIRIKENLRIAIEKVKENLRKELKKVDETLEKVKKIGMQVQLEIWNDRREYINKTLGSEYFLKMRVNMEKVVKSENVKEVEKKIRKLEQLIDRKTGKLTKEEFKLQKSAKRIDNIHKNWIRVRKQRSLPTRMRFKLLEISKKYANMTPMEQEKLKDEQEIKKLHEKIAEIEERKAQKLEILTNCKQKLKDLSEDKKKAKSMKKEMELTRKELKHLEIFEINILDKIDTISEKWSARRSRTVSLQSTSTCT